MNAHSKIIPVATVFNPILADAWRCNALKVEECLLFIRQYQRTIDERHEELFPGKLAHSPANVEKAEKLLPWRLSIYLEAVRAVTECEIKMTAIGMPFAQSSYAG